MPVLVQRQLLSAVVASVGNAFPCSFLFKHRTGLNFLQLFPHEFHSNRIDEPVHNGMHIITVVSVRNDTVFIDAPGL